MQKRYTIQFNTPLGRDVRRKILIHDGTFEQIISLENLFDAWEEFKVQKRKKLDVQLFELKLEDNIFLLREQLLSGHKRNVVYQQFRITDPKARVISKASVADRLLHHAIYRVLYPIFDQTFIFDSYSCRKGKGTHRGFRRLVQMVRQVSRNYTKPCWALKMDIKKFFDSVDHEILLHLLRQKIADEKLLDLLGQIIFSFEHSAGKGMPLGNLTSQLFANIYLDPLDKFIKHKLKAKYYLRYADDFLLLGSDSDELIGYLMEINQCVKNNLKLQIHPNKIYLRKLQWGIDFVGYISLPYYSLPRHRTVKRAFKKLKTMRSNDSESANKRTKASLQSYLGYLSHAKSYKVSKELKNED